MIRRTILWVIAAALGIVASAAVAWAASQLADQRIGLSSAPPSVVRGLAPGSSSGAMHSLSVLGTLRSPTSRGRAGPPVDDPGTSRRRARPRGDDSGGSGGHESTGPDD